MGQELPPHQAEHIADMAIEQKRKARGKMKARTLQSIRGSIAWKEFCKEPEDVRGRFLSKAKQTSLADEGRGEGAPAKWSLQACDARG